MKNIILIQNPLLISNLKIKYTSCTRLVSFLRFSGFSRAKHQSPYCVYEISPNFYEIASAKYKTVPNKFPYPVNELNSKIR